MARSGYEAAKILAPDNEIFLTDMKEQNQAFIAELEQLGVTFQMKEDPTDDLDESYDVVIKNPGIKYNHPTVLKARELNISVVNEVEVAFHYLKPNVNLIGVTGSNGKTTTVTLIHKMLEQNGKKAFLGGNIGLPFCHFVKDVQENDFVVLEISDHQLCDMYEFKTNVSVLTNIYPVHLDFHDSFERYKMIKKRIFNHHTKTDIAILNKDNEEGYLLTKDIASQKYYFSKKEKEQIYIEKEAIYYQNEFIINLADIKLKGEHNYENIMAAIGVVKIYGVKNESIISVLKEFGGVEHRIEYVTTMKGVSFYNDSKATNCESTKIALASFHQPTILILGGLDRGHSFEDLKDSLQNVKLIACYGETKERIKEFANKYHIEVTVSEDLETSTKKAFLNAQSGDVVLLSPACASWDQYESFEVRGNEFKRVVAQLEEEENESK